MSERKETISKIPPSRLDTIPNRFLGSRMMGVSQYATIPLGIVSCFDKRAELAVYTVLAAHANEDLADCAWPSVPTIARETGLKERAVQYTLRDLELGGYILGLRTRTPGHALTYRLQPVPEAFVTEYHGENDAAGGKSFYPLFFSMIKSIVDSGYWINVRMRGPDERNGVIDHLNAKREKNDETEENAGRFIPTPNIKFNLERRDMRKVKFPRQHFALGVEDHPPSRDEAVRQLESIECSIAQGMIPWSVMNAGINTAERICFIEEQRGITDPEQMHEAFEEVKTLSETAIRGMYHDAPLTA